MVKYDNCKNCVSNCEHAGKDREFVCPGGKPCIALVSFHSDGISKGGYKMRKYTQKELRQLVRLGVAEDYTNKPSEYIYTLRRLEKVGYSSGVYGINGELVQDTETGTLYAIIGRCSNLFILF